MNYVTTQIRRIAAISVAKRSSGLLTVLFALIVMLLMLTTGAWAQDNATITGTVVDASVGLGVPYSTTWSSSDFPCKNSYFGLVARPQGTSNYRPIPRSRMISPGLGGGTSSSSASIATDDGIRARRETPPAFMRTSGAGDKTTKGRAASVVVPQRWASSLVELRIRADVASNAK